VSTPSLSVLNGSLGGMFDHVGIRNADLGASERFYRTVLSVLVGGPSRGRRARRVGRLVDRGDRP
jgi:hypothetical protein